MKNIITNNVIIPQYNKQGIFLRRVRSFTCRNRPIKKNMINILKNYWPYFGLNFENRFINLNNVFNKKNSPIILEIGFGNGENLLYNALHYKKYNILGIEVYIPGISNIFNKIHHSKIHIDNLKIILHDATEVLKFMIQDNTIQIIQLFFPDPWPKKKHHKRRILNIEFIKLISKKLINNGILHIITDCKLYNEYIINNINIIKNFINLSDHFYYFISSNLKKMTYFEKKARLYKKNIFNLIFQCRK
ncbi:tRNA (guanosine(46)-N7)-methyltransferase TrmB [Buchnera aphidicola]|uniref:tRNA (guanine-N(7)-)-methyltransferase n=1 Tax=Buchnera aphidicola (Therioaphis trifolii) TaxID=1241884 RepID=A0A4D6YN73_9GAMM|nr:tRNA (guanosine(46)-N7)-methyltransferase TrmB [Buchnera aphidicola]QCI27358.1 tRNA (guanosine(46)-N7)-methyltransferase TrmB [Buchnera aphidicola (Therioaphis trifolii)]